MALGCNLKTETGGGSSGSVAPPKGPTAARPAATPEDFFEQIMDALASGSDGVVYDLMSKDARAMAAEEAKATAAMGPMAKALGIDPAEIAKLPPREAYVKMQTAAREAGARLDSAAGVKSTAQGHARAKLVATKIDGKRAVVTAEYPGGEKVEIGLVREGGSWKLAKAGPYAGL